MKNISILGATGSIGTQTLDVIRNSNNEIKLIGISANSSVNKIIEIIEEFSPKYVAMMDEESAKAVLDYCTSNKLNINIYSGIEGLEKIATLDEIDMVVTSVVGMIGLRPTIKAIEAKKDIALANKETLVVAGELVMEKAKEMGVDILPVDSEHSAIFQALNGYTEKDINKIILTASGGPFRGKDIEYLNEAAHIIYNGGVVAFPTETVYGLGANALKEDAVDKIFKAKGRPQDNPLIVHVASKNIDNLVEEIPEVAKELINKFWPGPLTIILKKKDIIPNRTSANLESVGIRMPSNDIALKLIELSGCPVAAPSANISGRPSPTDVERCIEDLDGKIDYIIGGSQSDVGVESTIVDCTVMPPIVLRPGGITLEMLREVCSDITIDKAIQGKPDENLKPKAPGMKYRHYAPKAKLKIIKGNKEKTIEKINEIVQNYIDNQKKVAILSTEELSSRFPLGEIINLGSEKNLYDVARNLFEALRKCDDINVDYILCQAFEEKGVGLAIMNRLNKAAGFDILEV